MVDLDANRLRCSVKLIIESFSFINSRSLLPNDSFLRYVDEESYVQNILLKSLFIVNDMSGFYIYKNIY